MKITITEVNGWSKTVAIEKNIACIGSAPDSDVILSAADIAPSHLQLLSSPLLPSSARLVNLDKVIAVISHGVETDLLPYHTCDIFDGDEIQLGGYRLAFSLPLSAGVVHSSGSIEARLVFASAVLHPEQPLEGLLTISNSGRQNNCQVRVAINGVPPSCYQIDPIPLLYSSAQEEVRLRLFHRQIVPDAGLHDITLTVTAPESYPGEAFVIRQGIFVMPVYRQEIRLIDDLARPEPQQTPAILNAEPLPDVLEPPMASYEPNLTTGRIANNPTTANTVLPIVPKPASTFNNRVLSDHTAIQQELSLEPMAKTPRISGELEPYLGNETIIQAETGSKPLTEPLPPDARQRSAPPQDRSKLKVIREQADDFWEVH